MSNWNFEPVVIDPPTLLPSPEEVRGLRLHVQLMETDPPIWRRIEVPSAISLPDLHDVIQASMGWRDCHLHQFRTGESHRSPGFLNAFAVAEGELGVPEAGIRLDQVISEVSDAIWYEYDFGDSWTHRLTIEAVLDEVPARARCTAAELACPPEDSGGPHGYSEWAAWVRADFAAAAAPPFFSNREEARRWLPAGWHPDVVDLDAINAAVALFDTKPVAITGEFADLVSRLGHRPRSPLGRLLRNPLFTAPVGVSAAEAAELTRPFRIFLQVIGDGTTLTSAKRLKPAVVRRLAEELGITAWWVGLCNREDQTWPVAMIREVARSVGLVSVRKGVLAPTAAARKTGGDSVKLLDHILSRLPIGRERSDREAGWLTLTVIGAEVDPASWDRVIAELLYDAGWRSAGAPSDVPPADNPTLEVIRIMNGGLGRWGQVTRPKPGLSAMARSAVAR